MGVLLSELIFFREERRKCIVFEINRVILQFTCFLKEKRKIILCLANIFANDRRM